MAPEASRRLSRRPRVRTALTATVGAVLALVAGAGAGNVHGTTTQRVVGWGAAAAFFLFGVVAVRALAGDLADRCSARGGRPAGVAARVAVSVLGYLVVVFMVLSVLSVPVQHLLLGGAISGIIVGIAAQQALGNVFAGLVLLLARPFTVGDHIRVRSGALGGEFDGAVVAMSPTYVSLQTAGGLLRVPNAGMLAAAVGPVPDPPGPADAAGTRAPGATPPAPEPSAAPAPSFTRR